MLVDAETNYSLFNHAFRRPSGVNSTAMVSSLSGAAASFSMSTAQHCFTSDFVTCSKRCKSAMPILSARSTCRVHSPQVHVVHILKRIIAGADTSWVGTPLRYTSSAGAAINHGLIFNLWLCPTASRGTRRTPPPSFLRTSCWYTQGIDGMRLGFPCDNLFTRLRV